jgi:hypothetical protein
MAGSEKLCSCTTFLESLFPVLNIVLFLWQWSSGSHCADCSYIGLLSCNLRDYLWSWPTNPNCCFPGFEKNISVYYSKSTKMTRRRLGCPVFEYLFEYLFEYFVGKIIHYSNNFWSNIRIIFDRIFE